VAFGLGGRTEDKEGALATLAAEPFGKVILALMLVGLAGYSLWGFVRAFLDPLGRGNDPKGQAVRAGYVVSAMTYGALLIPAIRLLAGSGGEQGSNGEAMTTAWFLSQPLGQWIVGLAGVVAAAGGLGQFYEAYSAGFMDDFKKSEMSESDRESAIRMGRIGHAARGVIFTLFGVFLVLAALRSNPNEARGLDGTLQLLAEQTYGQLILALVALGLVFFGVFSILCARWIQVRMTNVEG
jgi:hypothetical protein